MAYKKYHILHMHEIVISWSLILMFFSLLIKKATVLLIVSFSNILLVAKYIVHRKKEYS